MIIGMHFAALRGGALRANKGYMLAYCMGGSGIAGHPCVTKSASKYYISMFFFLGGDLPRNAYIDHVISWGNVEA